LGKEGYTGLGYNGTIVFAKTEWKKAEKSQRVQRTQKKGGLQGVSKKRRPGKGWKSKNKCYRTDPFNRVKSKGGEAAREWSIGGESRKNAI